MSAEMKTVSPGEVLLEARGLAKAFNGFTVVDELDLDIRRGEVLALIGPNGAGKTTVFNLLSGGLAADRGTVSYRGQQIGKLPQHRIARLGIGRTYQDLRLFGDLSVRDNVAVYCQGEKSSRLGRACVFPWMQIRDERRVRVEVAEVLDRLDLGELAGTRVSDISYAHQKLVALGRLLASKATLLLLDEPASGLDENERDEMVTAVGGLVAEGLTVCIVEHNMDLVRALADRVCFLAQGRAIAEGSPDEVFAASDLAEIYFGAGHADV
jgi:ABC-type branched-subunit amino acid transport system ATPase component